MKPAIFSILLLISGCSEPSNDGGLPPLNERKAMTYEELRGSLRGVEQEPQSIRPDIAGLESEVNNGGFNQYFINSSGQNCFETLRELRRRGKNQTANLLESAIHAINPNGLSEQDLIEKIRTRMLSELSEDDVIKELERLDEIFFTYPDGSLTPE